MFGSLLSEPGLMAAHHASIDRHGGGPSHAVERVAAYFRAEQALGRVAEHADPDAVAALLTGACFQQAFLAYFAGGLDAAPVPDEVAAALTRALTAALGTPA
jgi:hypothetical protein